MSSTSRRLAESLSDSAPDLHLPQPMPISWKSLSAMTRHDWHCSHGVEGLWLRTAQRLGAYVRQVSKATQ